MAPTTNNKNETKSPSPQKLNKTKLKAKWSSVSKTKMRAWAIENGADFTLAGKPVNKDTCPNRKILDVWVNHLWTSNIDYDLVRGGPEGPTLGNKLEFADK